MAARQVDESRSVECPVCFTSMVDKSPRALRCLHTFCESCIKQVAIGGFIVTCPTCRLPTPLPLTGVAGLPVNFFIKQLAEKEYSGDKTCENCEEAKRPPQTAAKLCKTCESFLCDTCTSRHKAIPAFTDHEIQLLNPIKGHDLHIACDIHNRKITVYCARCRVFICDKCALGENHKGHERELQNCRQALDKIKASAKPQFGALTVEIDERLNYIESTVSQFDKIQAQIRQEGNRMISNINRQVQHLISKVERNHKAVLLSEQRQISNIQSKTGNYSAVLNLSLPENKEQLEMLRLSESQLVVFQARIRNVSRSRPCTIEFQPSSSFQDVGKIVSLLPQQSSTAKRMKLTHQERGVRGRDSCTVCMKKLRFPWMKCGMCVDFKLCCACERGVIKHPGEHCFLKIRVDSKLPDKTPPIDPALFRQDIFSFVRRLPPCSTCKYSLGRVFYACGRCPEFYVCEACEEEMDSANRRLHEGHVLIRMNPKLYCKIINLRRPLL